MNTKTMQQEDPSRTTRAVRTLLSATCVALLVMAAGSLAAPEAEDGEADQPFTGSIDESRCSEGLPPGHPPIEAMELPPGHPPLEELLDLPPGHPPVGALPRLPAGHPPVPVTPVPSQLFPQQRTVII